LLSSTFVEAAILAQFPEWSRWLTPLVIGTCLVTLLLLVLKKLIHQSTRRAWTGLAVATGVLALLIAPTVWAFIPVWYGGDAGLPFAGPDLLAKARQHDTPNVEPLVDYLLSSQQDEAFLLATLNAREAAPIILATGQPVMALGGFTGSDRILSADQLAGLVDSGTVRHFLLPRQGNQQPDLVRWVVKHGVPVPPQLWQAIPRRALRPGDRHAVAQQLLDCGTPLAGLSPAASETI
jgi:4-amino-4-deoxy-L-arabinose transferase-like glycosyltransferase